MRLMMMLIAFGLSLNQTYAAELRKDVATQSLTEGSKNQSIKKQKTSDSAPNETNSMPSKEEKEIKEDYPVRSEPRWMGKANF